MKAGQSYSCFFFLGVYNIREKRIANFKKEITVFRLDGYGYQFGILLICI